jgi:hypothetical protein
MSSVIVYRFMGGVMYPCKTEAQTRGRIMRGFTAIKSFWRKEYRLDVRVKRSNVEGVKITVKPAIGDDGRDYRGIARDRRSIELHSGWIAKLQKWIDLFPTSMGLGQIVMHEELHILGLNHSPDERDLMHSDAPATLTTTLPFMLRKFGRIKTKSLRESEEVEAVLKAARVVNPCYTGRIEF